MALYITGGSLTHWRLLALPSYHIYLHNHISPTLAETVDKDNMAVMDPAQDDPLMRAIPIMGELDTVLMENLRQAGRMRELGTTAKVRCMCAKGGWEALTWSCVVSVEQGYRIADWICAEEVCLCHAHASSI